MLAWVVVLTHCRDLSQTNAFDGLQPLMQSSRAVQGFFALSGCLIVASWKRSNSLAGYFTRHEKRTLPGYRLALAFCLFLGSALSACSFVQFWASSETWKYIVANLVLLNFLHASLPVVFSSNPTTSAMDGAPWTIKIEVAVYLLALLLFWLVRRIGPARALSGAFLASIFYRASLEHFEKYTLAIQVPGQLAFFMVGAAVYLSYAFFEADWKLMWAVALVLFTLSCFFHVALLDAIATPLLVMCAALLLPATCVITRYGDFSYGTYVLHFPIIQTFVAFHLFSRWPWRTALLVLIAVSGCAALSWFTVERRFLFSRRVREGRGRPRRSDRKALRGGAPLLAQYFSPGLFSGIIER